uniref:Uncharacterized protein n=1 Tax=Quercus lobata TaxID=97700 RepID=A0A7N2R9S6_QUELO
MSQDVGEEIGSKLGKFIEVDRRSWQSDQAKFMRVRVKLEIDKPLRRGAYIASSEGLVGGKRSLEKGETWGSEDSTCADGQLVGDVQACIGPTEQLMSAAIGQELSVLGSCEKSRGQLWQDFSIEHRGSFSHGPKSPAPQSPKGSNPQGSPRTKAPLDKNEKDNPEKKNPANAIQVGVIFQAKAHGKGKQIMGKGNLKKAARAKGKVSDDQTLAQMLKIGTKRLRPNEASKEENS